MQTAIPFMNTVRAFCQDCMLTAAEHPLEHRVLLVHAGLAGVVSAAVSLPVLPGERVPFGTTILDDVGCPPFGVYEDYWTVGDLANPGPPLPLKLSESLRFVFGQLWAGLDRWDAGEPERAVGIWSLGFEDAWGPTAMEILNALHPAVAGYRGDRRKTAKGERSVEMPVLGGGMLEVESTVEPAHGGPVELAPCQGGLEVLAVGDAQGLVIGDVILNIDGDPADLLDLSTVVDQPEPRRLEVYRQGETVFVKTAL